MANKRKLRSTEKEPEPEPESDEEEEESEEEESEEEDEEAEESEEEEEEEADEDDEEEEDLSNREKLRTLLEPFSKDQLIELLKEAATRNPSLLSRISESAESDPAHRKIFVHGLGWDCTTDTLAAAFRHFGSIKECHVVTDRTTGRSKGYGFVLFNTRRGARNALKEPQKVIGGRTTSCQLASKGYNPAADGGGRKVFVSNIRANVNPERLKAFFSRFGEIEEGPLMSGKTSGHAIFVYKMAEGCKKALEEPVKVFEGCALQCQRALEGMKPKVPGAMTVPAVSTLPPNDLALTNAPTYGNLAGGSLGQGMGLQSGGVGLLNPVAGVSQSVSRTATPSSYGTGPGVNTVSPSVIGSYQSQAALQGLGGYQSQSTMSPGMRSQSSLGSSGFGLPSYLGR